MKILWILLGGHHKTGLFFGSLLCISGSFLRSVYKMGIFYFLGGGGGVAQISNIFFGMPGIPDVIFGRH